MLASPCQARSTYATAANRWTCSLPACETPWPGREPFTYSCQPLWPAQYEEIKGQATPQIETQAGVNGAPIFRTLTDVYDEFSEEMRFSHVTLFVTPIGMRVMAGAQALLRTQVAGN